MSDSAFSKLRISTLPNPFADGSVTLRCVETYRIAVPRVRSLGQISLTYYNLTITIAFKKKDIYPALRVLSDIMFDPEKQSPGVRVFIGQIEWPLLANLVIPTSQGHLVLDEAGELGLLSLLGLFILKLDAEANTFVIRFPDTCAGHEKFFQNKSLLFYYDNPANPHYFELVESLKAWDKDDIN